MTDEGFMGEALGGPRLPAHIYVHVPFCRVKCSYCDFYSETELDGYRIGAFIEALEAQLSQWARLGLPGVLETLYIGGGTPTMIAAGLVGIVREAMEKFPVRANPEVTVEANPDSVTPQLMEALAAGGVNRISMGVQSFVDTELAMLGRLHTVEEAVRACRAVTDAGMGLSVDLICGIPRQTMPTWLVSLEAALTTGADHISVYPLTLEEGTPLYVACDTGLAPTPNVDLTADMMIAAEERLRSAGMERYEVASYARPGHESRHNIAYWSGRSYIGVGPAAHGMLDAETAAVVGLRKKGAREGDKVPDVARVRYAERADLEAWLTGVAPEIETLTAEEVAREDIMLGLRLTRGVPTSQVEAAGLTEVLESLADRGLTERYETRPGQPYWRTTRRGWLLGNEVFGEVWNSG